MAKARKGKLAEFRPQRVNANRHTVRGLKMLDDSMAEDGYVAPITVAADGEAIDGSARLERAAERFAGVDPLVVEHDGRRPVVMVRTDIPSADTPAARRIALRANRIAQADLDWDAEVLAGLVQDDPATLRALFADDELAAVLAGAEQPPPAEDPGAQVDRAAELQAKWGVESGDLWALGDHRLVCGDCTDPATVARVMGGEKPDAMITDPPYSSGGFQEAGRASGSVGTTAHGKKPAIKNDTLSTRGYQTLMRAVLLSCGAGVIYVFTDWRMWINLFDISESSGFGVRNMIVWDKGSPGMGMGWRTQHELVLFASRVAHKFDKHKAVGNVQRFDRTGNVLHTTEKPVGLIESILFVTDWADIVYDPFSGSGTTLIACERLGRRCWAVEIAPQYVAVALERWHQMTGRTPEQVA